MIRTKQQFITDEHYAIAEKNGIKRENVYQRVNTYYWDVELAITKKVEKKGDLWHRYEDLATQNGVTRNAFYYRTSVKKEDPVLAATKPLRKAKRPKTYVTQTKIADFKEIDIESSDHKWF